MTFNPRAACIYIALAILMAGAISVGNIAVYVIGAVTVLYTLIAVI